MLTRAFLLTTLERDMYFKLAKIITMCTSFELGYLKELPLDFESENNTWISSLQLYGLFTHKEDEYPFWLWQIIKTKQYQFWRGFKRETANYWIQPSTAASGFNCSKLGGNESRRNMNAKAYYHFFGIQFDSPWHSAYNVFLENQGGKELCKLF